MSHPLDIIDFNRDLPCSSSLNLNIYVLHIPTSLPLRMLTYEALNTHGQPIIDVFHVLSIIRMNSMSCGPSGEEGDDEKDVGEEYRLMDGIDDLIWNWRYEGSI